MQTEKHDRYITLREPIHIAVDDSYFFYFYLSKKIRFDVSCESSA